MLSREKWASFLPVGRDFGEPEVPHLQVGFSPEQSKWVAEDPAVEEPA